MQRISYIWKQAIFNEFHQVVTERQERKLIAEHGCLKDAYVFMNRVDHNWHSPTQKYRYAAFDIPNTNYLHNVKCFQDSDVAKVYLNRYLQQQSQKQQQQQQSSSKKLFSVTQDEPSKISAQDLENGEHILALTTSGRGQLQLHLLTGVGRGSKGAIKHVTLHEFPEGHQYPLWGLDYDREKNEKIAVTAGHDRNIIMWDVLNGDAMHTFRTAHSSEIWVRV